MHTQTNPHSLTSALQFGSVVVLSSLAVTFEAALGIQTEASFTHLRTKQRAFISICKQAESRQHVLQVHSVYGWL